MIAIVVVTQRGYEALSYHPASLHAEWDPKKKSGEVYFSSGRGALAALKEAVETVGDRL